MRERGRGAWEQEAHSRRREAVLTHLLIYGLIAALTVAVVMYAGASWDSVGQATDLR